VKTMELSIEVCYNTQISNVHNGVMNLKLEPVFKNLGSDVFTCCITTDKFKSSRFSVSFILPKTYDRVAAEHLIAGLMTDSCEEYPDFVGFGRKLAMLYGASVSGDVVNLGDCHAVRFSVSCLADRFALGGEKITRECAELLCSMIFKPNFVNGVFAQDEFDNEKRQLVESAEGIINDKIKYAFSRARQLMCPDEPFGMPEAGGLQRINALTNEAAAEALRNMLRTAPVYLSFIGPDEPSEVISVFTRCLDKIDRKTVPVAASTLISAQGSIRSYLEKMDVAQSKLVIGMRSGIGMRDLQSEALRVAVDILGGGVYSLLFTNVREKMSLCYYCSAKLSALKGIVFVESGVEADRADQARDAILKQLDDIKNGNFSSEILEFSKLSFSNLLKTLYDSPSAIDTWYFMRCFDGSVASLDGYSSAISCVSRKDVIKAANCIVPDTVYLLTGKED